MALITCPECGKQISETTPSCPHCGYQLSTEVKANTPEPTRIGEVKTSKSIGISALFLGVLCCFFSFLFGPLFILPMFGGVMLLIVGWGQLTGMQPVTCPHCGRVAQISCKAENFKCPACKKTSVRKGDYLHPVS